MPQGYQNIGRIDPVTLTTAAGVTTSFFALWVGANSAELDKKIKILSGSTVLIMADNNGTTMAGGTLVANFNAGNFYPLGTTEVLAVGGPASFYLASLGSSATASLFRGVGPTQLV